MTDLLRLCRLYYAVPMALAYTLTVCYALGGEMDGQWVGTLLSSSALALVIAAAYVFNDVCDRQVDCINSPQRPIAVGRVRPGVAIVMSTALLAAGLTIGAMCRRELLAVLSLVAVGLVIYDLFSKRLGIGKQILVAALMTSIYPLAFAQAGGAAGNRAATLAIFPVWMFLTSFGYEVLKDVRDVRGDLAATARPSWIQRNPRLGRQVSAAAILVGAVALIGPCLTGCGSLYMSIAALAMLAAIAAAFQSTRRAMTLIYVECLLVGVAATADLIFLGR
ncbi:MAG TPA: UbiA family prenyltransferase [Phycisphaerae bacterium]|nr:UbiA family prenyltransferase [Phycisphaerae bacterium]